ncbi:type II toxin-antitoxin system prevent-host-death family antitoxin [Arthrobacter sp. KNU40]|uniref:type II toxin-antitoxin system prevent-host-death family antitoxin n=1 Tax=Arthrobacter sp. KNU40 TaxID=3447965 RepID=UPI003F5E4FA8
MRYLRTRGESRKSAHLYVQYNQEAATAMITRKPRRDHGLIERVNLDRPVIEIVSRSESAVLMSKDSFDAPAKSVHLLSSSANAHHLISAVLPPGVDAAPDPGDRD